MFNDVAEQFEAFFTRENTFSLGVCNGCQMLSNLKSLIPGSDLWPRFVRNESERFEARFSLVEVQKSDSVFFDGMAGSRMPIAVSHGEGRVEVTGSDHLAAIEQSGTVAVRYVDNLVNRLSSTRITPMVRKMPVQVRHSRWPCHYYDASPRACFPHCGELMGGVGNENGAWMRMFQNAQKPWLTE